MLYLRNEASAFHGFGDSFCSITAVKWDAHDVEITSGKATEDYANRGALLRRILYVFIPVT